jgi:hypothetical protein
LTNLAKAKERILWIGLPPCFVIKRFFACYVKRANMEVNSFRVRFFLVLIMLAVLCAPVAAVGGRLEAPPSQVTYALTPVQKDFLKAVTDDLRKIGSVKTAENIERYIAEGRVVFEMDDASVKGGADTPISKNILCVQEQKLNDWVAAGEQFAKFHGKGNSKGEKNAIADLEFTIRDVALTLIHEDVHMGQHNPLQYPTDEDPAYETQIRETKRIINEDMQEIQEILDRGAKLPGDQARLNELIQDLKASKMSYNGTINDLQTMIEKSKEAPIAILGIVDPTKFETAESDRKKLVKEANDLIKMAGIEKERSFASLGKIMVTDFGKIMGTKGAFFSRGNIKGGTDHLGFANCLCKCACSQGGWACGSGVACVYDANPKGECLCAGLGEGHTTVPSSGECYEDCAREYKITGMQSNKTPLAPVNPSGYNPIMPGDLIQTTGETVIILKDGSKLLVKPGSIINFTSTQSGKTEVNLILGSFRMEHATGGSTNAGGPDVKIADKTVKPKGTEFICQWDGASGKVSVVDGSVSIADETSEKTLEAGKQMDLPQGTVTDYNLSADDGGLVAGIPLRDLPLDEGESEPFGEYDPSFADGKIPDDWLWQDPGSDAEFGSAPSGGLMVTVPDGNEFWGYPGVTAGQRSDAPRLLHKVTGDFDLQGRVYLDTEATDLATVEFLYYSPGSYIGLKSGLMKQDLLGEHYNLPGGGWLRSGGLNKLPILGRPPVVTYTGYSAELKSSPDAPDQPVFLKFTRRGNVWKTYHSRDGEKWILSSREEVNASQTLWVGWVFKRFAYDGLTDKNAIVTLDDVRLKTAEPGTLAIPEWDEILQAGSAEIDGNTVRLHLDGSGKATTSVQKGIGLVGDFSATVSFQAENRGPEPGESRLLALVASNSNGQNRTYIGWLHDPNHPSQFYVTNFFSSGHGSGSAHDYTGDWSGKLRIVRQDNNISTYFWKDGEWKVLGDFGTGFHDPVYIGMEVTNEQEASANASMTAEFTVDEIIGNAASEIKTTAEGETQTNLPAATGKTDDSAGKTDDATGKTDDATGKTDDATGKTDDATGKTDDTAGNTDEGASAVKPESESNVIFDNWNTGGVSNNPSCNPSFTITEPQRITYIDSYHWNDGSGTVEPGTISLAKDDATEFGPWQAEGQPGMNGVPNAFWITHPDEVIPAGTYEILDSDQETRSQNSASGGCGFSKVEGYADQSRPSDSANGISTKNLPSNEPPANEPIGETSNIPSDEQSSGTPKHWHDYANDSAKLGKSTPDDAELVFVVGDIDNMGFGWPEGFDVFSGNSAPVHSYPWKPDASDPAGTDRIMVGTSYDGHPPAGEDGYASATSRPDNTPEFITIWYDLGETKIKSAILQMFVDDFQSPVWKSNFQATINGRRAPFLEDVLNSLDQTGPIGKLITVQIPEKFLGELKSGVLTIDIDDPTTGAGDGFAVDFVRLLINPKTMTNTGTVSGTVTDEETQSPIKGAIVSTSESIKSSTDPNGEYILKEVPAGLAAVKVSKGGYVSQTKTADLTSGGDAELDFQCQKM